MYKVSKDFLLNYKNFFNSIDFENFIDACFAHLSKSIKLINTFVSIDEFKELVSSLWWTLKNTNLWDDLFWDIFYVDRQDKNIAIWKTILHLIWLFYIQEVSASIPAHLIINDLQPWSKIIDISSAPWWKTIQLLDYMNWKYPTNPWMLIANDIDFKRLISLKINLNRIGLSNFWITNYSWQDLQKYFSDFFDFTLLDAPCSWEWTCFKSLDVLQNWKLNDIKKIADLQFQLLESALNITKQWWTIIYSTCTLNPIENELNILKLLEKYNWKISIEKIDLPNISRWILTSEIIKKYSDINLSDDLIDEINSKICRIWPHIQKQWGFFVCKIRKNFQTNNKILVNKSFVSKIERTKTLQNEVKLYLKKVWNIKNIGSEHFFYYKNWIIYYSTYDFSYLFNQIKINDIWLPILKKIKNGFIPLHNFAKIFWNIIWKNKSDLILELNDEQMQKYVEHQDLELEGCNLKENWFVIIKWKKYFVSVWKIVINNNWGITLKNKFIER